MTRHTLHEFVMREAASTGHRKVDRPIIFSGSMVKSLIAGRKTMTRRLATSPLAKCQPSDLLWVREAFCAGKAVGGYILDVDPDETPDGETVDVIYRADEEQTALWRPSIHMPRWASRLTLTVTEVKIERLQDISEEDAIAEGLLAQEGDGGGPGAGYKWKGTGYHGGLIGKFGPAFHIPHRDGAAGCSCNVGGPSPAQCAFRELWERLHGTGAWQTYSKVVALRFTVEHRNIDAPPSSSASMPVTGHG